MNFSKAQKSAIIIIVGCLALFLVGQEELGAVGIVAAGIILFFDSIS